jgi:hypothetical protein
VGRAWASDLLVKQCSGKSKQPKLMKRTDAKQGVFFGWTESLSRARIICSDGFEPADIRTIVSLLTMPHAHR